MNSLLLMKMKNFIQLKIFNDESIKIKGNDSHTAIPLNETNPNINTNVEKSKGIKKKKPKKNYDFSKYEIVEKRDDLIIYRYSKKRVFLHKS